MRRGALLCALFPLAVLLSNPRDAALGPFSVDLGGHLWTAWSAAQGELPRSHLIGWPEGVDLTPVLGGWLDVVLAGGLSHLVGLVFAYNLVIALYLWVAGLGGAALARALGAGPGPAILAGLLLQTDAFLLQHARGGRPEQVGPGFVALLFAAVIRRARGEGSALACGLAAAGLVFVSWELSLLAGLALLWMAPALGREGLRRLAPGLGWSLALAGPWVLFFLSRALDTRATDEGDFALQTATRASALLTGWPNAPIALGRLALLTLPFTLRERRAGGLALGGLALAGLLALGPAPGWSAPGDLGVPGPFALLRGLPILGWFHWPDRLLAVHSVAAAVALAMLVTRAPKRLGLALALLALGNAAFALRWPRAGWRPEAPAAVRALGALPEAGAVLDLPIQPDRARHLGYQLDQLTHGRPILLNMVLPHLQPGEAAPGDPVLAWFTALMEAAPPAPRRFGPEDWRGLRHRGYRFAVLHQEGWPGDRWQMGRDALATSLGEPILSEGQAWLCWRIPDPPTGD